MDWATQSDDLAALAAADAAASATPASIAATIEQRLRTGRPHAYVGNNLLVAVGATSPAPANAPAGTPSPANAPAGTPSPAQYAAAGAPDAAADAQPGADAAAPAPSLLPPHPLQLATSVFFQMLEQSEDQTVVFFGLPGSGKSVCRRMFSQQLIELSRKGKKKSRLLSGAAKMEIALEAFGHARTPTSPSASAYGRYAEYQFSSSGRMVGVKLLDYAFDHARVSAGTALPDGERNFHIFYQLLAGATSEERERLKITDPNSFFYLKGSKLPKNATTLTRSNTLGRSNTLSRRANAGATGTLGRSNTLLRREVASPTSPTQNGGSAAAQAGAGHDNTSPTPEDAARFQELRENLKSLGVGRRMQAQIYRVLAAILHLGNVAFATDPNLKDDESTIIRNQEALDTAAELLGLSPRSLADSLRYRSKFVGRELCSIYLQPEAAVDQRNALAETIYAQLFSWLVEHINTRLCKPEDDINTFIGLVDFPWFRAQHVGSAASFPIFVGNYVQERLVHYVQNTLFDDVDFILKTDGVQVTVPAYQDNQWSVDVFRGTPRQRGLWSLLEEVPEVPADASTLNRTSVILDTFDDALKANPHYVPSHKCEAVATTNTAASTSKRMFGIRHFHADPMVQYDLDAFLDQGTQMSDFVALFRGAAGLVDPSGGADDDDNSDKTKHETNMSFAASLFSRRTGVRTVRSGRSGILGAQKAQAPMRKPSIKRKKKAKKEDGGEPEKTDEKTDDTAISGRKSPNASTSVFSTTSEAIDELLDTLKATRHWSVIACSLSDTPGSTNVSVQHLQSQLELFSIPDLCQFRAARDVDASHGMKYTTFAEKYSALFAAKGSSWTSPSPKDLVKQFVAAQYWPSREVVLGNTMVFLSMTRWRWIYATMKRISSGDGGATLAVAEDSNQGVGKRHSSFSTVQSQGVAQPWMVSRRDSYMTEDERSEVESNYESEYGYNDGGAGPGGAGAAYDVELGKAPNEKGGAKAAMASGAPGAGASNREIVDKVVAVTPARKCWVCCTWSLTWWIPSFMLGCCGLKRPDIRMAWREKVALCIIILFLCLSLLFFIIGLRYIICPTQNVKSLDEVSKMSYGFANKRVAWFSANGRYLYAQDLMDQHIRDYGPASGTPNVDTYVFESMYGTDVSKLFYNQDRWNVFCPGIAAPQAGWDYLSSDVDWMKRGGPVMTLATHRGLSPSGYPQPYYESLLRFSKGRVGWTLQSVLGMTTVKTRYVVIYDNVYFVSPIDSLQNTSFSYTVRSLLSTNPGQDITPQWAATRLSSAAAMADLDASLRCMNYMFYIGTVDRRNTFQCQLTNYLLLSTSIVIVVVIGVKFLAALQFGARKDPEECDKFVILMVPCYTEGTESLAKTLDSLAALQYDDKRKLLFIICDGMIIGSGNDRPTPRLVLDILGVDPAVDPPALAFQSLGEGSRQFNMGKVYSGLYKLQGHAVPFVVVVKSGAPTERVKPGNRGKRDSQLVLMRFLNRVHFNADMSPLELEIYHHMNNIIGVAPSFYEFVLMVDADTEVEPSALNRMISVMVHDIKVMGLCGETRISNEKDSWVTAIQVYEYFISHHLAKAFESLFGTVTCLPGCFCMYRVRSASKNVPLLVAHGLLADYSENTVDTLHMKNLLHLGEDRYLTTLMLKHFPQMRTKFTPEARCHTVVPDRWSVLQSQRRRWINSTVHNLFELVFLDQLCGFCCFSMRFVVLLDLFSTFVQPAAILYVAYLVYSTVTDRDVFPTLSIILIASIYGLQVIIFFIKREWQHVVWMFIYILAMPIFSFYLPVYAFWHFDDFSWGNTRVVVGEGKKTVYVTDAEPFDPNAIPLKRWRGDKPPKSSSSDDMDKPLGYGLAARDADQMSWERGSQASRSSAQSGASGKYAVGRGAKGNDSSEAVGQTTLLSLPAQSQDVRPVSMVSLGGFGAAGGERFSVASTMPTIVATTNSQRASVVGPSDDQLLTEIRRIISGADLMKLTKKQIRDDLSARFGVDLKSRKEAINRMIDDVLQGRS